LQHPQRAQRKLRSFYNKRYFFCKSKWCGNVTFLAAKKVTKEGGLRRRYEKAPSLRILPPLRHPVSKNVPIFEHLPLKTCKFSLCRCPKIGTFSGIGWQCARRGFLRGHAFSECPLKSPSFGTFLGDQEKYMTAPLFTKKYTFSPVLIYFCSGGGNFLYTVPAFGRCPRSLASSETVTNS